MRYPARPVDEHQERDESGTARNGRSEAGVETYMQWVHRLMVGPGEASMDRHSTHFGRLRGGVKTLVTSSTCFYSVKCGSRTGEDIPVTADFPVVQ